MKKNSHVMMHVQTTSLNVFVPDVLQVMSICNKTLVQYIFVYFRYRNLTIIYSTIARNANDKERHT